MGAKDCKVLETTAAFWDEAFCPVLVKHLTPYCVPTSVSTQLCQGLKAVDLKALKSSVEKLLSGGANLDVVDLIGEFANAAGVAPTGEAFLNTYIVPVARCQLRKYSAGEAALA